jgi:hypothetical protein
MQYRSSQGSEEDQEVSASSEDHVSEEVRYVIC